MNLAIDEITRLYAAQKEATLLLHTLTEAVHIPPEVKYKFDFGKYMKHLDHCHEPYAGKPCKCGMFSVMFTVESLLDECAGYQGSAINKALAFTSLETNADIDNYLAGERTAIVNDHVLELAVRKLSEAFNEFVAACIDEQGTPKTPDRRDVMKARACLPPYCTHAFSKKEKHMSGC